MMDFQNLLNLKGKTAIVTGGARGIGRAISERLAQAGANVMIADLSQEIADGAAGEISGAGGSAKGIAADVSEEADVERMMKETVKAFSGIDILVNNAGIYPNILLMQMTRDDFHRVLKTNLDGVFLCTQQAAKQMILQARGGKIINVTSIDALHPSSPGLAHYDASKHGVWGFTKNVALELAPHKIWVNAIAPGGIATYGVGQMQKDMKAPKGVDMTKMVEAFMNKIPMHRMGEPDDIGKVALFLASDMSSYMTGSQIVVDGGVLLS